MWASVTKELPVRIDKCLALELATRFAPDFLEIFHDCKSPESWGPMVKKFGEITSRLKIRNYVLLYEDERRIHAALMNSLLSEEEQATAVAKYLSATPECQHEMLANLARPGGVAEQVADDLFPSTPEEEQELIQNFRDMTVGEQQETIKRAQFMVGFFLAYLHQVLAVMVHGEKMTSLVPKALGVNDKEVSKEAFLKAIHIDKTLILEHPGFQEVHARAIAERDGEFLGKIARRLSAPVTQGRIRMGGIFLVFAMLESLGWLGEVSHSKILMATDKAGFDRWNNRIEDEAAVSKALAKYRRYQKTGGLSMH